MTLLVTLLHHTASATDLHWKLLTFCVPNKFSGGSVTLAILRESVNKKFSLAIMLFTYRSCAVGLIHCPALLLPLAIADLDLGSVALPHGVPDGLLAEGDLTRLFEVLLTLLFLARTELGDVGVVTLLYVPVGALQHGLLGQTLHRVLFDHTQSPVRRPRRLTEVDTTKNENT